MNITTKTLSGAEISVAIGGQNTEIRNDGAATVYASANSGIVAGADGVVAIPAGAAVTVLDTRGRVYLLGTGEVSVVGKDTVSAVFKCAPTAGGSGQDDIARQAIAAHEGNTTVHVTAAEKAAWNAVNYSNPNLLNNPDFRVNQRGLASYSSSYTVDRWKTGGAKLTVNDGFINLENTTEKATATIYQFFENPAVLSGKTVTLSFDYDLKTEGAWISVQAVTNGTWSPSAPVQLTDTGRNVKSTVITLPENLTDLRLALVTHSTDSAPFAIVDIYGAKLELGSIATPIIPADPATELAKCQRYYQIRSTGDVEEVDLRPSMRATPTITQLSDGNYAYSAEL